MLNAQAFKKRHALWIFLLLAIAYAIYMLSKISPLEQSIIHEEKINNQVNIFITEASEGATTNFSYNFYLYDSSKSAENFKSALKDNYSPFLITSDANALRKVERGVIYLDVKGKVFVFNNTPAYKYNNSIYTVPVVITARPY